MKQLNHNILIILFSVVLVGTASAQRDILLPPGNNTCWHGVYLPFSGAISEYVILQFESDANKKIGAEMVYVGWYADAWKGIVQPRIDVWEPMGIITHVVWEPFVGSDPLGTILNGSQNNVIDDFATQAKAYGKPFFLRFAHEMNGNWYPWGAQTPQKYIDAWRYVWNRFQTIGATNTVWVWSPNWNPASNQYYPGDDYVDWVGVDFYGLAWDNVDPWTKIDAVYSTYSHKPIMATEVAAADRDHYAPGVTYTKDTWIRDLFRAFADRPNVKAFFWFNESYWSITSSPAPAAQIAYQNGVADPRYVTRVGGYQPFTVIITSPSNGALFAAPANITINALAFLSNGSVTKVEFFEGDTKLGEDTFSPHSYTWSNVPEGSYMLTARATNDSGVTIISSPVNIAVGPPASGSSMEAENMSLTNYIVNINSSASGGSLIKLSGSGVTGNATYQFSEATDTYDIKVWYYDENDGACTFRIYVGGTIVDEWIANQNLGSADPVAQTRTSRTKTSVSIANGDEIKLEAVQNSQEWGRYDRIEITASNTNVKSIHSEFRFIDFALDQNYPNPFNPETHIRYQLPEVSNVQLDIYDITGSKVRELVNRQQSTGVYSVLWDGLDESGHRISNGMCLYRIKAKGSTQTFIQVKKMLLLK